MSVHWTKKDIWKWEINYAWLNVEIPLIRCTDSPVYFIYFTSSSLLRLKKKFLFVVETQFSRIIRRVRRRKRRIKNWFSKSSCAKHTITRERNKKDRRVNAPPMRFQLEYLMSQKIPFLSSSLIRTRMIYCEVVLSVSTAVFFFFIA